MDDKSVYRHQNLGDSAPRDFVWGQATQPPGPPSPLPMKYCAQSRLISLNYVVAVSQFQC